VHLEEIFFCEIRRKDIKIFEKLKYCMFFPADPTDEGADKSADRSSSECEIFAL